MPDSGQAVFVIVLIMPGILGFLVFSKLYRKSIDDNVDKVAYIFLLNLVSIAIFGYSADFSDLLGIDYGNIKIDDINKFSRNLLIPLSLISMVFAVVWSFVLNTGKFQKLLNKLKLTPRTPHSSVLADVVATHPDAFLRLHMKNGGYLVGHVRKYSLSGDENVLFLDKAVRRRAKKASDKNAPDERHIDGPGILLLNFDEISFAEVLDGVDP